MTRMHTGDRPAAPLALRSAVAAVAAVLVVAAVAGCDIDAPGDAVPKAAPNAASTAVTGTPTGAPTTGGDDTAVPSPWASGPSVLVGRSGTPAGGAPPAPSAVNGRDPVAVSRTVVAITWTVDTAMDASGWDAEMRAAPYLAPDYLKTVQENPPERGSGGEWMTWAAHQAYTTVEVESADELGKPEDTAVKAFHAWRVVVKATGRDGWQGQASERVVYVVLTRTDASADWKVSSLDTR